MPFYSIGKKIEKIRSDQKDEMGKKKTMSSSLAKSTEMAPVEINDQVSLTETLKQAVREVESKN